MNDFNNNENRDNIEQYQNNTGNDLNNSLPLYNQPNQNFSSTNNQMYNNVIRPDYIQQSNANKPFIDNAPTQEVLSSVLSSTGDRPKDKTIKMISKRTSTVIIAASIILSMGMGFGGGFIAKTLSEKDISTSNDPVQTTDNDGNLVIQKVVTTVNNSDNKDNTVLTTAEVAELTTDSVVEIRTETVVNGGYYIQQYVSEGAGSGVVISKDGYIITNNHVIEDATSIKITLKNGETYDAKLIGTDSELDVALLKIEATDLKFAIFGSSADLKVGEDIVAIGNPLGELGGTVTEGIVSALDRDITMDGVTNSLLQISAAINPGNSGGGVFNSKGELVALVVAKASSTGVEGLGFAIPIDDIVNILSDLKSYGYVKGKVALGVTLLDVSSQDVAWRYQVDKFGVYVYQSDSNDLKIGDRIISIDGENISSSGEVASAIKGHKVGDKLTFIVERNGSEREVEVELIEKTQN